MRNDEKPTIVSFKQLKKELKEFTETTLHAKFRWTTVEKWIMEILRERVEDIVMGALGYEWDEHYSGTRGKWKMKDHFNEAKVGIPKVLEQMATHYVTQYLPELHAEKAEAIKAKVLSSANRRAIIKEFEYTFDKKLREKIEEWVTEHAEQEIDLVFETHGEEFLKEIKLKHKLTMDSLQILSGEDQ
jgi:hypothetical protein